MSPRLRWALFELVAVLLGLAGLALVCFSEPPGSGWRIGAVLLICSVFLLPVETEPPEDDPDS